ncbi:MAG: metallophosphoesterase family protein [Chloroflexota bacterium]
MKLLLFSDLHCDATAAQAIVARAQTVDVVVGAGDFGNIRRGLEITIDILKVINKPTVLVAGNSESTEELEQSCQGWHTAQVLHGSGIKIDGIPFYGIGGGIPITPFGSWSYDFTEEQAQVLLADCPSGGVLVSHSPPKGAVDRSSRGQSIGSVAIREAIERQKPRLVVCGHIHGSAGQQAMIGESTVINAGPKGIIWDLEIQP